GALHALATGLLIDIRITGIFVPAMTLGFVVLELLADRDAPRRRFLIAAAVYCALTWIVIVACWPAIWSHPIGGFAESFSRMSSFNWGQAVLYEGQQLPPT